MKNLEEKIPCIACNSISYDKRIYIQGKGPICCKEGVQIIESDLMLTNLLEQVLKHPYLSEIN